MPIDTGELDYLLEGDPREVVVWHIRPDVWGNPVHGDRCTIAHLTATDTAAATRFGFGVEILQDAFNTDVDLSAGTHDYGRVLDGFIPRVDWWVQQRFLRELGWAAWYRFPPSFSQHIHKISLPVVDTGVRVGVLVPGQVDDYLATPPRNGLAGHPVDPTWHPSPIARFDYDRWKADNMQISDADIDKIVTRLLNTKIATSDGEATVQLCLRRAAQTPALVDDLEGGLTALAADVAGVKTDVAGVKAKVAAAQTKVLRAIEVVDQQVGPATP